MKQNKWQMPELVIRMIPKEIEYIPNSREDKGREIRPKSEINDAKMSQKKQNKIESALRKDMAMKWATYLAVGETESQQKVK